MPRRLPEKTKTINRRLGRFKRARYHPRVFQVKIVRIGGKFAIAEKTTV